MGLRELQAFDTRFLQVNLVDAEGRNLASPTTRRSHRPAGPSGVPPAQTICSSNALATLASK